MKSITNQNKQQIRSAESSIRRSKETPLKRADSNETLGKPHQMIGKSLKDAFGSVAQNISLETKDPFDSSPESEFQNHEISSISTILASPKAFGSSGSTPSSIIINDEQEVGPDNLEVEVIVDLLREARLRISNASDVDSRSKKLVDALIVVVMDDMYGLPAKSNRFSELGLTKMCIGLFCFFGWIVMVSVFLFSNSGEQSTFPDLPPT